MKKIVTIFVSVVVLMLCSCFSDSGISVKGVAVGESEPPVLLEVQSVDEKTIRLVFDKQITVCEDSFEPFETKNDGFGVVVTLDDSIEAGKSMILSGRVADQYGNTSEISTPVWGFNSNMAGLLINELCTKTEPKTEILVTSAGNIAGAVLYNGVPSNHQGKAILPDLDVEKGDFIVVWWTNEVVSPYGNDVLADTAIKGFSNNGIQTLATSPAAGATVIDCIAYSNGSSTYGGFGNAETEKRVQIAVDSGWWSKASDAVLSNQSTKLRTMCRKLAVNDTDTSKDWYIAENGGATFGLSNTALEYVPK